LTTRPARRSKEGREIRDDIEKRVHELVEVRADEIRTDRSGHQRRLAQLLHSLAEEFRETCSVLAAV